MGPHGKRSQAKAKNFKKSMAKIALYAKPYYLVMIIALLLSIAGAVCTVLGPRILGNITNEIQKGAITRTIDMDAIFKLGIKCVIIYLVSALAGYVANFLMSGAIQKLSRKLREDISKKINKIPLKYFDQRTFGDVLSRVTNDVDNISQNLNQSLTQIMSSITLFIGVLIMMFTISASLTFIAIGCLFVSFLLIPVIMKFAQKQFRLQQKNLGDINGHIEENYSGYLVVKAFNREDEQLEEFVGINKRLYSSGWKSQFFSGLMMPLMTFVGNISYVAVCVFGGIKAANGVMGIGDIQSFYQYVRLFSQPLSQMAQITNVLQSAAAAAERVFEFLDEEEMEKENVTKSIDKAKGNVVFDMVNFGYYEDKQIIHNFNCFVQAGMKVAIVGPTGAGKTTLVNILMRFYEINSGGVYIDGINTKDISRKNLREQFAMVLQDTWLFDGTIKENLKYGNPNATDEEIINACKMTYIHHFIMSLPHGYDSYIDETTNISAGQKQLITIARAMIANAPMLILDEATSSVDTRTEVLLQNAMNNLMKGRTSFVIAHRLSTIKDADMIIVMKNGNVVEVGNHDKLLEQKGFYFDLYNSQFQEA